MKTRTVGKVMIAEVVPTRRGTSFKDTARPLDKHRISGLPVVAHDDKVLRAISETDLIRRKPATPEPGTGRRLRSGPLRRTAGPTAVPRIPRTRDRAPPAFGTVNPAVTCLLLYSQPMLGHSTRETYSP